MLWPRCMSDMSPNAHTHTPLGTHQPRIFIFFLKNLPGPFPRSAFFFLFLSFFSFLSRPWFGSPGGPKLARLHWRNAIVHNHYCFHRLLGLVDKDMLHSSSWGFQHVSHGLIWHPSCSMFCPSVWDFLFLSPPAADGSCSHGSHQFMCVIPIIVLRAIDLL